ncbi:MAG: hypothetical protein WCV86_02775 [Patescibacteria group bacterium]|jgi:hypothetical protein
MANHDLDDLPTAARPLFTFTTRGDLDFVMNALNIQGPIFLDGHSAQMPGGTAAGFTKALVRFYGKHGHFPNEVTVFHHGRITPLEVHTTKPRRHAVIRTFSADGYWQLHLHLPDQNPTERICRIEELPDHIGPLSQYRLGPPPGKLDALLRLNEAFKHRVGLPPRASLRRILIGGRADWH